jgi:plastocyanin
MRIRVASLGLGLLCAYGVQRLSAAPTADLVGRVEILDKDKKRTPGAHTVVWIPGLTPASAPPTAGAPVMPTMASQDKRFAPHVLAVSAGTEIAFPNRDPIFHNVFSLTPENKFDLGLYRKGAAKSVRMTTPALVRIYCNIHADMAAFVLVLDRATFGVTDADGGYRLPAIPAGQYAVHIWNERTGEQTRAVTIDAAGPPARLDVLLDASAYQLQAHTNKYGRAYPPVSKDVDRY